MTFSKLFSIIFHPIFMPLVALYLTLSILPELSFTIDHKLPVIYSILIFSSILLPLTSILFLIKMNKIESLEMSKHKERILPLFNTGIYMLIGYFFLKNILIYTPLLKAELLGAIIIIFIACFLSIFWKISLHMLAIGGIVGIFIGIKLLYQSTSSFIILFILISGVLAYSRLNENAHNKPQVYIGFFIGLLIELVVVLNY